MLVLIFVATFLFPVISSGADDNTQTYLNYQVWSVDVSDAAVVKVNELERQGLVDVFTGTKEEIIFMVAPDNINQVRKVLKHVVIKVQVVNVENCIDSKLKRRRFRENTDKFSFEEYHDVDTIYSRLDEIASNKSDNAEVGILGTTHEKRKIKYIRISNKISDDVTRTKPVLWIDGGIHAREWVSTPTVMYIIETLLGYREPQHSEKVEEYLNKYQFYIIPVLNPDGYQYTRIHERLWRKNRIPGCYKKAGTLFGNCFFKNCYGVDLNRNFPIGFKGSSTSSNLCSLIYPGEEPIDQLESMAVKAKLEDLMKEATIGLFFTYHSYSQLFLTPYGYTGEKLPPDYEHHKSQGDKYVEAVYKRHGRNYTNQRAAELYSAGGVSPDWSYMTLSVIDSYTVELRPGPDSETIGFLLPANEILETGQENVDGLIALIENLKYKNTSS